MNFDIFAKRKKEKKNVNLTGLDRQASPVLLFYTTAEISSTYRTLRRAEHIPQGHLDVAYEMMVKFQQK